MRKKLVSLLLAAIFMVTLVCPLSAQNFEGGNPDDVVWEEGYEPDDYIEPHPQTSKISTYAVVDNRPTAKMSITNGTAYFSATASHSSASNIKVVVYFQQLRNGTWYDLTSKSKEGKGTVTAAGSRAVQSDGTYRAVPYATYTVNGVTTTVQGNPAY